MPIETFKISHKEAKALMNAATKSAKDHKVPGAIAIVDGNGNPILLECLDNTMMGASKIAIGKAATAIAFSRPTIDLENVILKGRTPMLVLDSAISDAYVPLKGGYPIIYKEEIIGAIAVAGTLDADMDEVVALEALESNFMKTVVTEINEI